MSTQQPQNKMNATQRLEALESYVAQLTAKIEQQFQIVADEFNRLQNINVALAKRLNAIIKAGDEGGVTSEAVKDAVVNDNARELKARVDQFIAQGLLVLDNEIEINEETFVVGRETDDEGKEINPRTQFHVGSLHQEARERAVIGKKVGDSVTNEETKVSIHITETYKIVQPKVQPTEAEEVAPSAEEPAAGAEVIRTKTKRTKKA